MLRNLRRIRSVLLQPIPNVRRMTTHIKATPVKGTTTKRTGPLRYNRLNTTVNRSSRPLLPFNGNLIGRIDRHFTRPITRVTPTLPVQINNILIFLRPYRVFQILLRLCRNLTLRPTRIRLLRPIRQGRLYPKGRRPHHLNNTLRQNSVSCLQ